MPKRSFLSTLSIKSKIILSIYSAIILVTTIMGYYSYRMSEINLINKVSVANLGIVREINSNINFLQHEVDDTSIQVGLNNIVQSYLKRKEGSLYIDNSLSYTMGLIANKSYNNFTILYGLDDKFVPYIGANDGSSGVYPFSTFERSNLYKQILALKGKPLWFVLQDQTQQLIENNKHPKIVMARMVRDLDNYQNIGLLIMSVNEEYIRKIYSSNLQTSSGRIVIMDDDGNVISQDGVEATSDKYKNDGFIAEASLKSVGSEGSIVDTIAGKKLLITYSSSNYVGWKIFYAVPLSTLTQESKSIKTITVFIVIGCLIVLLPFMLLISSLLTAPIKKLLASMKRFQEGHFDESVEITSSDEIGQLGRGYNKMVSNIKDLINEVYVLQIQERDAELTALQAQINPHFLYNTLDIISWKAQLSGDKELSSMIYSLSRFFRLSLNRGQSLTMVAHEKELIEHYLLLLKVRFKSKLTYEIRLDEDILQCLIPKLILQPFVENAVLHGLENQKAGGSIMITGVKQQEQICFIIEDDGVGMSEEAIHNVFNSTPVGPIDHSVLRGGYSVKNVNERLKLIYNDKYSLNFFSKPGKGTRVEIYVPAAENSLMEG
ncbi:cache domain-containing sensor histidine kinase [Paenibacillus psychroresistens]|nr:sensor histidine kinase [Paenibacillus psychroresistens]